MFLYVVFDPFNESFLHIHCVLDTAYALGGSGLQDKAYLSLSMSLVFLLCTWQRSECRLQGPWLFPTLALQCSVQWEVSSGPAVQLLKIFKHGRLHGLGLCPERREISSCLYKRKIVTEIKCIILKFCTVFSTVFKGILGFCEATLGLLKPCEGKRCQE